MGWANVVAGFVVGLLVGFTGVGGGALMTPILVFLFGVSPQTAVGTDLLFAFLTKSVGAWVHGKKNAIDWLVLRRLCLGSVPAALVAIALLRSGGSHQAKDRLILDLLGMTLIFTSVALVFKPQMHEVGKRLRSRSPVLFKRAQPSLTVLAGAVLGTLVTLTSIGAGALGAVALVYLYPFRLTATKIVATDIAHAIPLTLVAGLGHFSMGNINFPMLGSLLIGSIPGIVLGSLGSHRVGERYVRHAIALILVLVGGKMLLG